MNLFGWILVAVYGVLAWLSWENREVSESPKANAFVTILMLLTVFGILAVGTGTGL